MESHAKKFQRLLREMFQFDCADLDFGIYRIMNHKRDAIEKYIGETLPGTIAAALAEEKKRKTEASMALEEMARQVKNTLRSEAIAGPDMELAETYRDTTIGREYLEAKERAADMGDPVAIEAYVYAKLYGFFNRYYQDGDFISKRRSSGSRSRYAIPYNGEEVYLHWANSDQYYVKTTEHFHDYDWKAPGGVAVRFELRKADVEQNDIKGDKRFFLPLVGKIQWDEKAKKAVIPFEYRPLTAEEHAKYGKGPRQEKITAAAADDISSRVSEISPVLAAALSSEWRHNGNGSVSHLKHHLRQYARLSTSDFFIHKDLKGFLSRELDTYLKSEVLALDEMERAGERNAAGWFQKMRLIKAVGSDIIDFLVQIESFQKTLWEKRKFVAETNYCIAVGSIPANFHRAIASNEPQWSEWRELFDVDGSKADLFNTDQGVTGRRIAFLKKRSTLMVDTKHFDQEFTDDLLASFDNLDGATDGLLVHSENWQALNLLRETYSGDVKCVYIDPPFNTDASPIIYKNGYKDSSWLSMMENRLHASLEILEEDGVLCAAIDDVEHSNLNKLLKKVFGRRTGLGTAVVRSAPSGRTTPTGFSSAHEYALFFGKTHGAKAGKLRRTQKQIARYKEEDEMGRFQWVTFRKHGGANSYREKRPRLFYPVFVDEVRSIRVPAATWIDAKDEWQVDDAQSENETAVWPINSAGEERTWKWGRETMREKLLELCAKPNKNGKMDIYMKSRMKTGTLPKTWWDDKEYSAAEHGTALLAKLFGDARNFSFPKSDRLIEDCLLASDCHSESLVLDYFAGSGTTGHAVINLNREDGGRRKFILVEMGEYFDTVLVPRIKKVAYAPEWKNGKPQRMAKRKEAERGPRIIKRIRLESYEDTLNNIEFGRGTQLTLEDGCVDYLLRYMLRWETRESGTLLNVEKLASPFSYELRLHADGETRAIAVDIPETFNYLLGLNVRSRRTYDDGGRRYLVYRGGISGILGRTVAVIWRETAGWQEEDFIQDREFVAEHDLTGGGGRHSLRQRRLAHFRRKAGGKAVPGPNVCRDGCLIGQGQGHGRRQQRPTGRVQL